MTTWRDERRQDRIAQAGIARDDRAADAKLRTAELKAAQDRRLVRQKNRAARRLAMARWCTGNAVDLLLAPVILASVILSWDGMAVYGTADYGLTGVILPVLSEGGSWAFAFSAALCARRGQAHRLWSCRLGILVFAGYGAGLNFLHGDSRSGVTMGATMALVSLAGIIAHQLLKAGPQRSRADRHQARTERAAERREHAARRAAIRTARIELDSEGIARLVHAAGRGEMTRKWGRAVLTVEPVKPQAVAAIEGSSEPHGEPLAVTLPVAPDEPPAVVVDDPLPQVPDEPSGDPQDDPQDDPSERLPADPRHDPVPAPGDDPPVAPAKSPAASRRRTARTPRLKAEKVAQLLRAGVPVAEIKTRTGASDSTIKRAKATLAQSAQVVDIADRRKALSRLRPHPP